MPRWPPLIFSPPRFTATGITPSGHDSPQTDAVVRAQALRARIAEEKVAILTAENDRLADEIARLRALLTPDAAQARAETEQQMQDLKTALLDLLDQSNATSLH